jgi:ketosteroid isomerase-like protein
MAYEVGRVKLTTPDGPAEGKYIVLWKQDADGTWRLHRDIWNMNAE